LILCRVRFAHEELVTRLNASERAVAREKAAHWGLMTPRWFQCPNFKLNHFPHIYSF
jgi:hypothetical protein